MALENYRITEFQEKTQVDNGDYVLIDSATDGTHKYQLSRIPAQASAEVAAAVAAEKTAREAADAAEVTARNAAISAAISDEVTARNEAIAANVDDTLAVSGKAADAKKTGDEIADVKSDLDDVEDRVETLEELTIVNVESSNKWNPNATTDGKYYLSSGALADNANYVLSDYIAVGAFAYVLPCAQFGSNPFKFIADGGVFFDSNKDFISGSKITTQTAYAVPNGASYVRVWFQKVDNQIYVGLSDSDSVPVYEEYYVRKENAMESRMTAVENQLSQAECDRIVCWGDSLTDGAGATGIPANGYPERLQTLLTSSGNSLTVANGGIGGEDTYAIGFRQGGIELQIDPFTIPASGASSAVTIHKWNGREVEILKRGGTNVTVNYTKLRLNPVTIAGIPGDLLRNNDGDIVFTRSSSGSAVTVSRPVPIFVDALANYNLDTDITVIWAGTNNIHDTGDVNVIIDSIKAMISMLKNSKYIVIGLTCKQVFSDIANMNFAMANAFDKHFLNIRDYLLEYGIDDAEADGMERTAEQETQDATDITNGEIPSSLRSDYVHLNDWSYQIVAEQVYKKGQELGYWL